MRLWLGLLLTSVPAVALAEDGGSADRPELTTTAEQAVIGGSATPAGKWPDAAALLWGGDEACSGTLIAPNAVLTAGHCLDDGFGGLDLPDAVLVGASALSRQSEGELLAVENGYIYPSYVTSIDASVLILASPSHVQPRAIASGWARLDITNGASVQLVGFGTTDRDGQLETDALMEASTTITDFDCSVMAGCEPGARPDGELGAGGDGIDTCPGDSGGPVYLLTDYGSYLAGITSRGYESNQYACSEGGIYARPDKIVDWIESKVGAPIQRGPEPTVAPISVVRGDAGETVIEPNDPKSSSHSYEITLQPAQGMAAVNDDGRVRVCADPAATGQDATEVTITDKADPARALTVRVPIAIEDGEAPASCDVNDFGDGGGCCDTRRSAGGSIPLAMVVLLAMRRRRK